MWRFSSVVIPKGGFLFFWTIFSFFQRNLQCINRTDYKADVDWDVFDSVSQISLCMWLSFPFSLAFLSLCSQRMSRIPVTEIQASVCLIDSSAQVCVWLKLFWVTHCSLCWTVEDKEKKHLQIPKFYMVPNLLYNYGKIKRGNDQKKYSRVFWPQIAEK